MTRSLRFALIVTLAGSAASAAGAPLFPAFVDRDGLRLKKVGEYRYVYKMFFKLYEVALFTETGAAAQSLSEVEGATHLQFRYLRKIDKEIILKSSARMLEKNLSSSERAQIADRVAQLNEAYRSVGKGDISSLSYLPGKGTILTINGREEVAIEGDDFARLYFRIWLGPKPISTSLKESLLGLR